MIGLIQVGLILLAIVVILFFTFKEYRIQVIRMGIVLVVTILGFVYLYYLNPDATSLKDYLK